MATAINFNWIISEKCTNGKIYDFSFIGMDGTRTALTFAYDGTNATVTNTNGNASKSTRVFRAGMRVKDAIALTIRKAGRVESGEVYKCNILQDINADYDTAEIYADIHQPSHDFTTNFPRRESAYYLGFELETAGRNNDCYYALTNFVSNIWRKVSDASIHGNGGGVEFVSTLLHPEDAIKPAFYESFCDMITGLAQSRTLDSTGLHCHISRTAFGDTEQEQDENIAKLIYLENYVLNDDNLRKVYGRGTNDWSRPNTDASNILNHVEALKTYAPNLITNAGIKSAICASLMRANKTRSGHNYPSERYHRINITNKYTVEFRQGKGNINSNAIATIAQHATTAAAFVRSTKWEKLTAENYYKFIPTTNKYALLKSIFKPSND